MKQSIKKLAMIALKIKSPTHMESFLEKALKVAFAEGSGAHIIDDECETYYRVPSNTNFECVCPECGVTLNIDLTDLVEDRPILT